MLLCFCLNLQTHLRHTGILYQCQLNDEHESDHERTDDHLQWWTDDHLQWWTLNSF